jgi:hypothetical protein
VALSTSECVGMVDGGIGPETFLECYGSSVVYSIRWVGTWEGIAPVGGDRIRPTIIGTGSKTMKVSRRMACNEGSSSYPPRSNA